MKNIPASYSNPCRQGAGQCCPRPICLEGAPPIHSWRACSPRNSWTLLAGAFTGNADQQSCRRDVAWIPTLCVSLDASHWTGTINCDRTTNSPADYLFLTGGSHSAFINPMSPFPKANRRSCAEAHRNFPCDDSCCWQHPKSGHRRRSRGGVEKLQPPSNTWL
jgi:hypothetical protein